MLPGIGPAPVASGPDAIGPKRMDISNDYCQHYIDTRERPQNFIRDAAPGEQWAEYPTIQHLLNCKDVLVRKRATPAAFLRTDLKTYPLRSLGMQFDVILVDPPWEEYTRRSGKDASRDCWTLDELSRLDVPSVADNTSFLFLWCGSGGASLDGSFQGHLEEGRVLMRKWGFRRVEDITWLKTNRSAALKTDTGEDGLLVRTKEHCLVGLKGRVKRNTDGDFLHANCDTDVIVDEEPPNGSSRKPEELYSVIERFCLGRRRLELFGESHNIRPGWLTLGRGLPPSHFDPARFRAQFDDDRAENRGEHPDGTPAPATRVGSTKVIEDLRPKSPPRGGPAAEHGYGKDLPQPAPYLGAHRPRGRKALTKELVEEEGRRMAEEVGMKLPGARAEAAAAAATAAVPAATPAAGFAAPAPVVPGGFNPFMMMVAGPYGAAPGMFHPSQLGLGGGGVPGMLPSMAPMMMGGPGGPGGLAPGMARPGAPFGAAPMPGGRPQPR